MVNPRVTHPPSATRAKADALIDEWRAGTPSNARQALIESPELLADRSVVLDLALEEFCLRRDRGDTLGPTSFRERFDSFGIDLASSIERLVAIELLADAQSIEKPTVAWPGSGDRIDDFLVLQELGRGGLGRAYLCRELSVGDRLVVVKKSVTPSTEAHLLGRLDHQNIIQVYSVRRDPSDGGSLICMPYLGKATLKHFIDHATAADEQLNGCRFLEWLTSQEDERVEIQERRWANFDPHELMCSIFADIASGLAYAHERAIVHHDIKPTNVVLTRGGAVLIDFNLSRNIDFPSSLLGGTLPYLAPERWSLLTHETGADSRFDPKAGDVYSLAVTIGEYLTGESPDILDSFHEDRKQDAIHALAAQQLLVKRATGLLPQRSRLGGFLLTCVSEDPSLRPTASQLSKVFADELPGHGEHRSRRTLGRRAAIGTAAAGFFTIVGGLRSFGEDLQARYEQGVASLKEGRYEQAWDQLSLVLQENDSHKGARYSRAWAAFLSGNSAPGIKDLERLYQQAPDDQVRAAIGYGFALSELYSQGAAWYEAIKGGMRNEAAVLNNYAVCLWRGRTRRERLEQIELARSLLHLAIEAEEGDCIVAINMVIFETELLWSFEPAASEEAARHAVAGLLECTESKEAKICVYRYYGWLASQSEEGFEFARQAFRRQLADGIVPQLSFWNTHDAFQSLRKDKVLDHAVRNANKQIEMPTLTLIDHPHVMRS